MNTHRIFIALNRQKFIFVFFKYNLYLVYDHIHDPADIFSVRKM